MFPWSNGNIPHDAICDMCLAGKKWNRTPGGFCEGCQNTAISPVPMSELRGRLKDVRVFVSNRYKAYGSFFYFSGTFQGQAR